MLQKTNTAFLKNEIHRFLWGLAVNQNDLNETYYHIQNIFLLLNFLVLREIISLRFYNKNMLQTNVKNALEQKTAQLHGQLFFLN